MASQNGNNMLPFDDLELEMEEVEGLVEVSNVGSGGKRSKAAQAGSAAVGVVAGCCSSKYRSRWGCFALVVLVAVILTLWLADTKDLEAAEGSAGSNVSDVDTKNATKITAAPTVKATPAPTAAAPKTAPPTATPKTEPPTAKVTPVPTAKATSPDEKTPESPPSTAAKPNDEQATPGTNEDTADAVPDEIPDNKENKVTEENAPVSSPKTKEEPKPAPQPDNANAEGGGESSASKKHTDYAYPSTPFVVRTENPPTPARLEEYAKTWGTWQLGDLPEMDRTAFCGDYPQCDVPRDKFPPNAWQSDTDFVTKFLNEADKLVDRARNAILAEYGKTPNTNETAMFDLTYRENLVRREKGAPDNGGWTTQKSMDGLARRLLHAIMTRDTFTFVMGGHSAAAGHGNHFKQSYTMQVHKILEPVLSYLGVPLITRNLAQGGLGTIQSALGAADIYGDEIDFMVWDSGMTEGRDGKAVDMFGRQALMGNKVPVLWNLNPNLLEMYREHCDADVGLLGTGEIGIPVTKDEVHAETLPYALQYYKCDDERGGMCREHKYMANCWVERPDVTPLKKQNDRPGGQASWHPGFRWHQLNGRILAYTVLTGLKEAIGLWKNEVELSDASWHVNEYYDNIRSKVMTLDTDLGNCNEYQNFLPDRVCKLQLRGRTEFTPRADPDVTSLRSMLITDGYMPTVADEILYDGPDVRNPMFDIPDGQVDVLAILNNGRKIPGDDTSRRRLEAAEVPRQRNLDTGDIKPGKGFALDHPNGYCDGSYNAICGRAPDSDCLLYGHHDGRGGLRFHEYSGWIKMNVPKVKHGIIMIKMETWHWADEVPIAEGWTTVNNERRMLHGEESENENRQLKRQPLPFCEDFHFDFAVDGKNTSWNLEQFKEASQNIQRVVEIFTMLDDPNYVKEGEERDVELAIRMHGCGKDKVFSLTHVYWA